MPLDATNPTDPRIEWLKAITTRVRQNAYAVLNVSCDENGIETKKYLKRNATLTAQVIDRHLNGGPHIGCYLFVPNDDGVATTVDLAAFDLDDHDATLPWQRMREVGVQLRSEAAKHGLNLWPVRSGGGSGIHLWAFWNGHEQQAASVRAVMRKVLTAIGFADGDGGIANGQIEIFPKQDNIDKGEYGNLIALPFARRSVPLNEDLEPCEVPLTCHASQPVPSPDPPVQTTPPAAKTRRKGPVPIAWVQEALRHIPNNGQHDRTADYSLYIRVGMATFNATSGSEEGFAAWYVWCKQHPRCGQKHDPRTDGWNYWLKKPPKRTGWGGLIKIVRRYVPDWKPPRRGTESKFHIANGVLCEWRKNPKGDGEYSEPLANFEASIVRDQLVDDGATQTRRYVINGTHEDGTAFPDATIDAAKIGNCGWLNEQWGARAILKTWAVRVFEEALKSVSDDVEPGYVYAHLGWRNTGDEWLYLHAGGAIGYDGPVDNVTVEIGGLLKYCVLPPATDRVAAVQASLKILDLGAVGAVVGAATYLAVLGEMMEITFSVHLAGETGTFKSAIKGIGQAHWGGHWNGKRFPANWADTANSIEMNAFVAKDTLFCVDDFVTRSHTKFANTGMYDKADRVFRGQGNQAGRARLDATIRQRPVYYPRGMVTSSGEDIPRGHSLRARLVIVPVNKGDIDSKKLAALQQDAASGLLAQAMAAYVRWIAGHWDELKPKLNARMKTLKQEVTGAHARTPDNYASLMIGCETFLEFAHDIGAIENSQRDTLLAQTEKHLQAVITMQDEEQKTEELTEVFVAALRNLLNSGQVYVEDWAKKTEPVGYEEACGWRKVDRWDGDLKTFVKVWDARGDRVGWLKTDTKELYLLEEIAINRVERLLNRPLAVANASMLRRQLNTAGLIAAHDEQRLTKHASGNTIVLSLKADLVLGAAEPSRSQAPEDDRPDF